MASVINRGNGRRAIQFDNLMGERKTIGLGKFPAKPAETIATKIESILSSRVAQLPLEMETAKWLAGLADPLYGRLADFGLVEPRHGAAVAATTVAGFAAEFIASRVDVKPRTVSNYRQAESRLVEFFGTTRKLATVSPLDADKFRSWLKGDKETKSGAGMAENSVRSIVKNAKLFFGAAVKGRVITENPFSGHSTAIIERPDRLQFVDLDTIERVLTACPNSEWRAIVALCRFGGLRCPSEVLTLRWNDIDWDRGRMRVQSPKLKGQQGEFREVPLFPELRVVLEEHMIEPEGADFVINNQRGGTSTNLRTTFEKIVCRAKVEPWKKPFQNLRSSRETELAQQYPVHVVTKWLGNSPKVAMAHYLQIRDADFNRAIGRPHQSEGSDGAAQALQYPSASLRKTSPALGAENQKPLVLSEKPTKQGVSEFRKVPPAGVEPAT